MRCNAQKMQLKKDEMKKYATKTMQKIAETAQKMQRKPCGMHIYFTICIDFANHYHLPVVNSTPPSKIIFIVVSTFG